MLFRKQRGHQSRMVLIFHPFSPVNLPTTKYIIIPSLILDKRYPIPSVLTSPNGTPQSLLTSSLSQTFGHLLCCSCCHHGGSSQSPLGPCDPKAWGQGQGLSLPYSFYIWIEQYTVYAIRPPSGGQMGLMTHSRSTSVFTSWKFNFNQLERKERRELGNKLPLYSSLQWTVHKQCFSPADLESSFIAETSWKDGQPSNASLGVCFPSFFLSLLFSLSCCPGFAPPQRH